MKRAHWIIAFFGICVVTSLVVLPVDDPKTPYNESDTPISLATPVSISTAPNTQLLLPASRPVTLFQHRHVGAGDGSLMYSAMTVLGMAVTHTCLDFLCVLLC